MLRLDSNIRELFRKTTALVKLQGKEITIKGSIKKLAMKNDNKVYTVLSKLNTSELVNGQDINFLQGKNMLNSNVMLRKIV